MKGPRAPLIEGPVRRFRAYPEYKDSGIEWFGEIPKHWNKRRLKHLCIHSALYGANESTESYLDEGIRFLRTTDITDGGDLTEQDAVFVDQSSAQGYILSDGDLLLSRSGTLGRALHYRSEKHGPCAYAGYLVRFVLGPELDPSFAFYFTKTRSFQQWLSVSAVQSTIGNINGQKYSNIVLPVPDAFEQSAIVKFLDRETARIDALILKKEKMVDLLQEKRRAIIAEVVTKGLDPDVPTKASGVEWMGEIPANWGLRRLKGLATLQSGITLGKRYDSAELVDRPYLRVANVQAGYLDIGQMAEISLPIRDVGKYELFPGDVLVTEGGDFDKLGRGYVWEGQIPGCLHQNHIFVIRTNPRLLSPYFLSAVLGCQYGRAYFTATSVQSTNLASTNSKKLGNFLIPLPSLRKQREIMDFISIEEGRIGTALRKVQEAIKILREYRVSLISAAVTGRIDIREEVA